MGMACSWAKQAAASAFSRAPNKQKNEAVEIVELASTSVGRSKVATHTHMHASVEAAPGASGATKAADSVVRI